MQNQKKITSIVQRKNSSKCKIFFNDESSIECSLDLIIKYNLGKNSIINDKLENAILKEQNIFDIKQTALNYASYKPRTNFQVKNKLKEKGFNSSEIQIAIDFLTEFNLLNDEKYAKIFIKDYLLKKPCGKNKLKQELYKRGISKNLIEDSVNKYFPDNKTMDLAKKASEKKLRTISYKPIDKQKKSLISFLQRQGFNWNIIKEMLDSYFDE